MQRNRTILAKMTSAMDQAAVNNGGSYKAQPLRQGGGTTVEEIIPQEIIRFDGTTYAFGCNGRFILDHAVIMCTTPWAWVGLCAKRSAVEVALYFASPDDMRTLARTLLAMAETRAAQREAAS